MGAFELYLVIFNNNKNFEVLKYNQHVEEDAHIWIIVTLCCELLQHLWLHSEWLCDCVQGVISLALVKSLATMNYSSD